MTEAEWLACKEPEQMLELVRVAGDLRKSRLLACACSRRIWDLLIEPSSRAAVEVAERFADRLASGDERAAAFAAAAREAAGWTNCCGATDASIGFASSSAAFAVADAETMAEEADAAGDRVGDVLVMAEAQHPEIWPAPLIVAVLDASCAISSAAYGWALAQMPGWDDGPEFRKDWEAAAITAGGRRVEDIGLSREGAATDYETAVRESVQAAEDAAQTDLLRDIFGNPFRPVAADPSWLTTTAVAIACQMYDTRDFSAMPILADALQDVGCTDEAILTHCRGPGPHVRGCWVLDLVLGKG